MIKKPNNYDQTASYTGEAEALPVGPHCCIIRSARVEDGNYGQMLIVAFDISEGTKLDGFYARKFDRAHQYSASAKWPGTFRCGLTDREGNAGRMFKGFIEAVEQSNNGYNFWPTGDELTLKGKRVAFNFGEREFIGSQDNEIHVTVSPVYAVSVERAKEGMEPPKRKTVDKETASAVTQGFTPAPADDDLPF